jgi:hypothetical protein
MILNAYIKESRSNTFFYFHCATRLENKGVFGNKMLECPICYSDIDTSNHIHTPCNHHFHETCLTKWSLADENKEKTKIPCPMCRQSLDMVMLLFGGLFTDVTESLFGNEPFYLSFGHLD